MPFLSFYTPTYRRPQQLAACLASVGAQQGLAPGTIEQIVIVDHDGLGVGGMFAQVERYAMAVHGEYVHFLCDDDRLAGPNVVSDLRQAIRDLGDPELVIVRALKGALELPIGAAWPPVCGQIDLSCFVTRSDVWQRFSHCYGHRYEGDFDFAQALADAGIVGRFVDLRFVVGGVSKGAPEEQARRLDVSGVEMVGP